MDEKIFCHFFKLKFIRKDIEKDYIEEKEKLIHYYNKIIMLTLYIVSIADSALNSFYFEFKHILKFQIVVYSSYFISFIFTIFTLICFFSKNTKILKSIHYINYFLLFVVFINFRYTILRLGGIETIFFFFLLILEITIRLIWVLIGLMGFMEIFVLNGLSMIIIWVLYLPTSTQESYFSNAMNLLAYSLSFIVVVFFSYVLERQSKYGYYFRWISEKKAIWFNSVLENINVGYLFVRGDKIDYINPYLKNNISKSKNNFQSDIITNENNQKVISTYENNIENDSKILKLINSFHEEFKNSNYLNLTATFIKYISQIYDINNFKLISDLTIDTYDGELSFEIYCRYNKSDTAGDELHFLLNDVTKTKLKEKQLAEFKYRTLFLSKVAHEFKNPLVCIAELINEIDDKIDILENHNLNENFIQIKSLSNYLLILIKDFNYFAESQLGKENILLNQKTNLNEIIEFCSLITKSLIKNTNKVDSIKFISIINDNVPKTLMTDEWRLKQVLINLLSNSVKFTFYGKIELEVSIENRYYKNMIKFLVRDTGTGIKEENKSKLFTPFNKEFSDYNNQMGSGLGLSIANEISEKLGEGISFSSEFGKGSLFWFYVKSINTDDFNDINENDHNDINEFENEIELIENVNNNTQLDINTKIEEFNPDSIIINKSFNYNFNNSYSNSNFNNSPIIGLIARQDYNNQDQLDQKENYKFNVKDFFKNNITNLRGDNHPVNNIEENNQNYDNISLIPSHNKFLNVIVVDDEMMTRKACIRTINKISFEIGIKINIIEAEDGLECLYLIYKSCSQGIRISLIFSDENMNFMNGSRCSKIIKEIIEKKNLNEIPFYLVIAYDVKIVQNFIGPSIKQILSKPPNKEEVKKIIYEVLNKL